MMDFATGAIAATAGTAAAMYLNGKYHLSKDIRALRMMKYAEKVALKAADEKRQSLFYVFEATANKYPTRRMIWSRTGSYTFAEAYERIMQYANWLLSLGVKPKEAVGLYATNSPEFVFVVMACWAIGCFPAMINYNLADAPLVHCVTVAKAKILVVDEEADLVSRIQGSQKAFAELGIQPVILTENTKQQITTFKTDRPPNWMRDHAVGNFPGTLIYTSGTTGLPKAFGFQTQRIYIETVRFPTTLFQTIDEVWYGCMPMYHGTGFIFTFLAMLSGMTCAVGKKFSVSNFWKDIHDSGATGFIYVGETARYLLAAPPGPYDRAHSVRVMYGNGLRPDVWDKFQTRFGVPEVSEFFSSTEGMFTTQIYTRSGFGAKSVGHHGLIFRMLLHNTMVPVALDPNTNDMYRDPKTGFATRIPYEQGGEIIIKIPGKEGWPGYHNNKAATDKKFATDVFEKGDVYYRPGDALRRDPDGLWFFMDRLGDTFRWKGENVSTAEVQDIMGEFPGLGEANIYGVEVPGSEGRAGCAAVMLDAGVGAHPEKFNWAGLARHLRDKLPRYAVPVFVRIIDSDAQAMGSHNNKQNKVLLRNEGANPTQIGSQVSHGSKDKLYWLTPASDAYVPFGQSEWESIVAGKAKL